MCLTKFSSQPPPVLQDVQVAMSFQTYYGGGRNVNMALEEIPSDYFCSICECEISMLLISNRYGKKRIHQTHGHILSTGVYVSLLWWVLRAAKAEARVTIVLNLWKPISEEPDWWITSLENAVSSGSYY
jgi:hypothetical protein